MSGNWKNKLEQYEQVPPKGIWESIAQKLDEENSLQNRMLNYEAAPPKGLWDNIAQRLDERQEVAPVILTEKKTNRRLFWSIAASVVSIALLGIFFLNNKPAAVDSQVVTAASKQPVENSLPKANTAESVIPAPVTASTQQESNRAIAQPVKKRPVVKEDREIDIAYVKTDEVTPLAGPPVFDKNKKITSSDGQTVNDISLMNSPSSYITITGPNGETVKVSSKFSKVINYLEDRPAGSEEYIDKVIKEAVLWRGKFKDWKEKMINNSMAPAPANFMDIIELSKVVIEK
jgi:hypothetical protein